MTRNIRPIGGPSRVGGIATVLLALSPVLVPFVVVLLIGALFLALMVVDAFGKGFAVGCAALAAVIGLPSIGLLWLSAVLRFLGGGGARGPVVVRRPALIDDVEERYRTGDFIHRDYEAEQRAHEAERQAAEADWRARDGIG